MIKAEMVTKTFENFHALDNISCRIPKGCIYGMVGSNGAGKSTFLRLLTGVYKSDGGTIRIDDEEVYNNPAVKNKIAYVPDELYFLPGSTMERMGTLYGEIYPAFDKDYYQYLADSFQLDLKKPIHAFSKGMKRQAAAILAISSKPEYLFFDETFDGLDPIMRNLVKSFVCRDVLERNTTVIITSHSLRELEDICDQLALLHKGGLVLESDIQYLKTSLFKIQTAFTRDHNEDSFAAVDILHYSKKGSVINLIARGGQEEITARIKSMQPLILDILPLSLEEIFTYEMEALGYNFQNVLEGETNEK